MWDNIPPELKEFRQWICWRSEIVNGRDTKVPYNPKGGLADTTDPSTWASFEEAKEVAQQNSIGIGFVFSDQDPYTGIDIDDKDHKPATQEEKEVQQKIVEAFDCYTERSPSGKGLHIIVKGTFEGMGRDRNSVGVYTRGRYFTFTGEVVRPSPIRDQQELLHQLLNQMPAGNTVELDNGYQDDLLDAKGLHELALKARNGQKWEKLSRGDWQSDYPSQSEADFAALSILAFYTRDNDLVKHLFRLTPLGERPKAMNNDNYLNRALSKIRSSQPPLIDLNNFMSSAVNQHTGEVQLQQPNRVVPQDDDAGSVIVNNTTLKTVDNEFGHESTPSLVVPDSSIPLPPGLVGQLAQYIYSSAVRPVPEVALAAALALTSGLCSRAYNISGTGLNQYLILLAGTGIGKEGASNGIDRIVNAIRPTVPMISQFVGPGAYASGQALVKVLDEKPCFLSIMGEFGLTLQQLCDPRANSAQIMLKKILLDVYNKSGWHNELKGSAYSDTDKNTKYVRAPNITILGESTPETFFGNLESTHISEGLVPRFSIVEYKGKRPARNPHAGFAPDAGLVQQVADLVVTSLTTNNNGHCVEVQMDAAATQLADAYDVEVDAIMNTAQADIDKQLYNRAHVKVLKLSALLAVGVNPYEPVVTEDLVAWAIAFTRKEIKVMVDRFHSGEVGKGENRQEAEIRRAVEDFWAMSELRRANYKVPSKLLQGEFIPFTYLRRRLRQRAAFADDRRGSTRALQEALADMLRAEILGQVSPLQANQEFGVTTDLYVKGAAW